MDFKSLLQTMDTIKESVQQPAVQIFNDYDEVVAEFDQMPPRLKSALQGSDFGAVQWLADLARKDPDLDMSTIEKMVFSNGHVIEVQEYLDDLYESVHKAGPGGYGNRHGSETQTDQYGKPIGKVSLAKMGPKDDTPKKRGAPVKADKPLTGKDDPKNKKVGDLFGRTTGDVPTGKKGTKVSKMDDADKEEKKKEKAEKKSLKDWIEVSEHNQLNEEDVSVKPIQASQIIGADGKSMGTADPATANAIKAAAEKGTLNLSGDDSSSSSSSSTQPMTEKSDKPVKTDASAEGKYKGKSKSELLKAFKHLKKIGPHEKGSKQNENMKELADAIRAKGDSGKVQETGEGPHDWMQSMKKTASNMQAKHPLPQKTKQAKKPKSAQHQPQPRKSDKEHKAGIDKQMAKYYSDNNDTHRHIGDSYNPTKRMMESEEGASRQPAVQIINDFDEVVSTFDYMPKGLRRHLHSSEFDAVQWLADVTKSDPEFDITTIEKIVIAPNVYGPEEYTIDVQQYLDDLDLTEADDDFEQEDEAYIACIVQHNRSGQAVVQRTKPISRDRAEEVIKHALSKNTFVHPPFMTIYPASAGKLDGSTIMAQFPDMSQEAGPANTGMMEGAKSEKFDPLKHVKNPTPGEKAAAKDVKRGSYADRSAMLKSAENDGRLKGVDEAKDLPGDQDDLDVAPPKGKLTSADFKALGDKKKKVKEGRTMQILEGINFKELMASADSEVQEMLIELQDDVEMFKKTGHTSELIDSFLKVHLHHSKKRITDEAAGAGRGSVNPPLVNPSAPLPPARSAAPGWGRDDYKPLVPDTSPRPAMGTIKGGVWNADPPKPGERGVPVPMDPEGVKEGNFLSTLGQSNKTFESKKMKDIQLENWEKELNSLLTINEGITVSTSTGQQGSPDSVSVNATDGDSAELLQVLRQAGLGVFGGEEERSSYGSPMHSHEPTGAGSEPEMSPAVVGDGDDMMALIKKMSGIQDSGEPEGVAVVDVSSEEGDDEHSHYGSDNHDHEEDHSDKEETDEGNAFGNEVRTKKADNIPDSQQRITTGGQNLPVKEEGHNHEGHETCNECGMYEARCVCEPGKEQVEEGQLDEKFGGNAAQDAQYNKAHTSEWMRSPDRLQNRQDDIEAGNLPPEELKKRMQGVANTNIRNTWPGHQTKSKLPGAARPAYRGPDNPYAEGIEEDYANEAGHEEMASLKHLLNVGNDMHYPKEKQSVGNPTQVTYETKLLKDSTSLLQDFRKLSGIK